MRLHEKDPDIYIENCVVITCLSNIDPEVKKNIFYFSDLTVLKLCTFFPKISVNGMLPQSSGSSFPCH